MKKLLLLGLTLFMVSIIAIPVIFVAPILVAVGSGNGLAVAQIAAYCGQASTTTTPTTTTTPGSSASPTNPNAGLSDDPRLPAAVKAQTVGNIRLTLAMDMGSYMESRWSAFAVGAGGWGYYQIQKGPPKDWHPDISIAQTQDPVASTAYMLGAYTKALSDVERDFPGAWTKVTPEMPLPGEFAAEKTAYYAEHPAGEYINTRGQQVVLEAYNKAVGNMDKNGPAPIGFGVNPTTTPSAGTCPGATNPGSILVASGNSIALAKQLLALPDSRLQYDTVYGVSIKQEIQDTADGKLVTPGPIDNSSGGIGPCPNGRVPTPISAEILRFIVTMLQKYQSMRIGSLTASHTCDSGRHSYGRAVDIGAVNGINFIDAGNVYSFAHMEFYRQVHTDAMAILKQIEPKGSFVNGRAVNMGGLGQQQCVLPPINAPPGFNYFNDACDHLHADVGFAS